MQIKNRLIKFSITSGLLALVVAVSGVGVASAATLTFDTTSVVSDGVLTLNGAAGSALNLGTTNTTGVITIGHVSASTGNVVINGGITGGTNTLFNNATTSNITIAGALSSGVYTVGTVAATGNTIYRGTQTTGTNSLFDNTTTSNTTAFAGQLGGTIAIGGTAGTGLITLGSSTGTGQIVTIGGGATAGSDVVNIGTGTAVTMKTVNIGAVGAVAAPSTIHIADTSNTAVQLVTIGSKAAAANITTIQGGNGVGAIALTPTGAGSIVIGATDGTGAITLGNSTGAQTVNIGIGGTAAKTVVIGDTNTSSRVTINAGTGLIVTNGGTARNVTGSAINSTATATAAQMVGGLITSTSAIATDITTPTATAIAALIPGAAQGTSFDLLIDNSAGASLVTLVLDGSITVPSTVVITGGATLTVAGSGTNEVGLFRFTFTSGTTAVVNRIF